MDLDPFTETFEAAIEKSDKKGSSCKKVKGLVGLIMLFFEKEDHFYTSRMFIFQFTAPYCAEKLANTGCCHF